MANVGEVKVLIGADARGLNQGLASAGASLQKFEGRAKAATSTAMAFGGIISDLPYGIRGVANNVEFAAQSFTYLRQQTGSTKAAISQLLSAFAGPAGIVSLLWIGSTAAVVFGDKIAAAFKGGSAAAEKAKKSFQEAIEKVLQFDKARGVHVSDAQIPDAIKELEKIIERRSVRIRKNREEVDKLNVAWARASESARGSDEAAAQKLLDIRERMKLLNAEIAAVEGRNAEDQKLMQTLQKRLKDVGAELRLAERLEAIGGKRVEDERKITAQFATQAQILTSTMRLLGPRMSRPGDNLKPRINRAGEVLSTFGMAAHGGPRMSSRDQEPTELEKIADRFRLINFELRQIPKVSEEARNSLQKSLGVSAVAAASFGSAVGEVVSQFILLEGKIGSIGNLAKRVFAQMAAQLAAAAAQAALLAFLFPGSGGFGKTFGSFFKGALGIPSTRVAPTTAAASGGITVQLAQPKVLPGGDLLFALEQANTFNNA